MPGLSPGSEAILGQMVGLGSSQRPVFLEKLVQTPEGRKTLAEAEAITDAMKERFGTDDLRNKNLG